MNKDLMLFLAGSGIMFWALNFVDLGKLIWRVWRERRAG